jgi:hypothetical protein
MTHAVKVITVRLRVQRDTCVSVQSVSGGSARKIGTMRTSPARRASTVRTSSVKNISKVNMRSVSTISTVGVGWRLRSFFLPILLPSYPHFFLPSYPSFLSFLPSYPPFLPYLLSSPHPSVLSVLPSFLPSFLPSCLPSSRYSENDFSEKNQHSRKQI